MNTANCDSLARGTGSRPLNTCGSERHAGARVLQSLGQLEHARTYRRMASLFRKADAVLVAHTKTNDVAAAQHIIQMLGREALVGNGDWLLLHRDRPMNLPNL